MYCLLKRIESLETSLDIDLHIKNLLYCRYSTVGLRVFMHDSKHRENWPLPVSARTDSIYYGVSVHKENTSILTRAQGRWLRHYAHPSYRVVCPMTNEAGHTDCPSALSANNND